LYFIIAPLQKRSRPSMGAGRDSLLSAAVDIHSCRVLALCLGWCCKPAAKLTPVHFQSRLIVQRLYLDLPMVCVG